MTEQWTDGPALKIKRAVAGCAILDSGMIVVAGGEQKNEVELLKPGASSWIDGNEAKHTVKSITLHTISVL